MVTKISIEKRQLGQFMQYINNREELRNLLQKVKLLRKDIHQYEVRNGQYNNKK